MRLCVDVDKIPRPERSGLISILAAYVLLTAFSRVELASYPSEALRSLHGWKAVVCYLLPCSILPGFFQDQTVEDAGLRPPLVKYVPLFFGSGKGGKPVCACHIDVMRRGVVSHYHFDNEPTCDSEYPFEFMRVWQKAPETTDEQGDKVVVLLPDATLNLDSGDSARFHCTTDDDK